jgi:hypothetical protein
MSKQAADGGASQDLPRLLKDILADLESALSNARNPPAKKLLQARIDRVRRAIDAIAASDPHVGCDAAVATARDITR